jgi:hypothetical protein
MKYQKQERTCPPALAHRQLVHAMAQYLRNLYPDHVVSVMIDDDDVPCGVAVFGIGEHGLVQFPLGYRNHDLVTD